MKDRKITRRKSGRRTANRRKTTRRKSIGERRKKNDSWSKEISRKSRSNG